MVYFPMLCVIRNNLPQGEAGCPGKVTPAPLEPRERPAQPLRCTQPLYLLCLLYLCESSSEPV